MKRTEISAADIGELLRLPALTHAEAAKCGRVGETALRGAIRRGEIDLPVIRVGSRRLIPTSAVRRWLGVESGATSDSVSPC